MTEDPLAHHQELVWLIARYANAAVTAIAMGDHERAFNELSAAWRLMLKTEWVRQSFVNGPSLGSAEFGAELAEIQSRHMVSAAVEDRYHIGRIGTIAALNAFRLAVSTAAHPTQPIDLRLTGVNDIHVEVKFTHPKPQEIPDESKN